MPLNIHLLHSALDICLDLLSTVSLPPVQEARRTPQGLQHNKADTDQEKRNSVEDKDSRLNKSAMSLTRGAWQNIILMAPHPYQFFV